MLEMTEGLKTRSEIYFFMCECGEKLRSDMDFKKEVKIKHLDESKFHLYNCQLIEDETRIFIWTEHCGYFYFHKEDIEEMEIWEWEWLEEEEKLKIVEHKIITNMEVKPSGDKTEETGFSD